MTPVAMITVMIPAAVKKPLQDVKNSTKERLKKIKGEVIEIDDN